VAWRGGMANGGENLAAWRNISAIIRSSASENLETISGAYQYGISYRNV
jgi:hypothetical protein